MQRFILIFLGWMALLTMSQGASASSSTKQKIPTKKIVIAVKAYANSVGCFIHMDKGNIVKYEIDGKPVYVALYDIDAACSGEKAISRPAFAALGFDNFRGKVSILPDHSNPAATSEKFPRFIDRIFIKDNQLWYTAKDSNRITVRAQVLYQNGFWLDSRTNP